MVGNGAAYRPKFLKEARAKKANEQLCQVTDNLKWELGGGVLAKTGAYSEPSQRQKGQHRSQERKSRGMDQRRPCLALALRLLA